MDGAQAALKIWHWGLVWATLYALVYVVAQNTGGKSAIQKGVHLYANRIASLLHASYICSLVLPIVLFVDGQGFFSLRNFGGENVSAHDTFLAVCGGWMAFDLFFEVFINTGVDLAMYAHHLLVLITCWFSLSEGKYGPELAVTTLMSEATTPFLSLKFILKHHGMDGTLLSMANDAVFAFGFLFLRIGWGTFILRAAIASEAMHWFVQFGGYAMTLINWFWARGIANKLYRHFVPTQGEQPGGSDELDTTTSGALNSPSPANVRRRQTTTMQ